MKYNELRFLILIVSVLLVQSCQNDQIEPESRYVDISKPFVETNPADVGVGELDQVISKAEGLLRLTSLLIIKDGKLILEEYFNEFDQYSLHDVRSATKSLTSLLVGIAIDDAKITSVNQSIGEILQGSSINLSPEQQAITIENLLTMSSGFEWQEVGGDGYNEWILSRDHLNYLLTKQIVDDPGSIYNYNSASTYLLGIALAHATGMSIPDYADLVLFSKIGIAEVKWETLSDGYVNGGAGIDIRPQDMARIGLLYLQEGNSADHKIVSKEWIDSSTRPYYSWRSNYGALTDLTYGYLWWIVDDPRGNYYFAWGFGGQFIFVVPDKNLVVVTTNNYRNSHEVGGQRVIEEQSLDLVINDILPMMPEMNK